MPPSYIIASQRLYLTADRSRVVLADDKDKATLYATPGTRIPLSAVEKFGLDENGLPKGAAAAGDEKGGNNPGSKSGTGGGNKQGNKGNDKSGKPKSGPGSSAGAGITVNKTAKAED